jgi:hypothetical protein
MDLEHGRERRMGEGGEGGRGVQEEAREDGFA